MVQNSAGQFVLLTRRRLSVPTPTYGGRPPTSGHKPKRASTRWQGLSLITTASEALPSWCCIGWRSQEHRKRRPHGAEWKDGGRDSSRHAGWRFLRANGIPEGRRQM